MKLANVDADAPEFFFIFTDRCKDKLFAQILEHNKMLREDKIVSGAFPQGANPQYLEQYRNGTAWYLPFIPSDQSPFGSFTPFTERATHRYRIEYNLELTRMQLFPLLPSRFTCLFAFGNMHDCMDYYNKYKNGDWRISSLKKYRIIDCGENNDLIRIARCNFKMIGAFEHFPFHYLSSQEQESLFTQYWLGSESLDGQLQVSGFDPAGLKCGNTYEYLIEGILEEVPFSNDEKAEITAAARKTDRVPNVGVAGRFETEATIA